jgi:hypothetical protein
MDLSTGRNEARISDVLVVSADGPTSRSQGLTVLRALAEEPRAVVWDLTGREVEPQALPPALDLIDGYLGHWDATALLVCADTPEKERVLQAHPVGGRVARFPTVGSALVAAHREIPTDRLFLDLTPVLGAPGLARRFVRTAVERWHVTHLLDRAELVVTELVTNTVVHALTPMTVTISRRSPAVPSGQGALRIAVRDADGNLPALRTPSVLLSAGRGLHLVDHFTTAWGAASTSSSGSIPTSCRPPSRSSTSASCCSGRVGSLLTGPPSRRCARTRSPGRIGPGRSRARTVLGVRWRSGCWPPASMLSMEQSRHRLSVPGTAAGQPHRCHQPDPARHRGPGLLAAQASRGQETSGGAAVSQAPDLRRHLPSAGRRRRKSATAKAWRRAGPGGHRGASQESSTAGSHPHTGTSDQPLPGPAQTTLRPSATPRKTEPTRPLEAAG